MLSVEGVGSTLAFHAGEDLRELQPTLAVERLLGGTSSSSIALIHATEMRSGSEEGSHLRLIDGCITQL